jgi:ComF family protein
MGKVDELLAWFIPRRCVLCNESGVAAAVCPGCRADLPWLGPACGACGAPLPAGVEAGRCGRCGRRRGARATVFAPLAYLFPVDRMIIGAKFHCQLYHARALGELLAAALDEDGRGRDGCDFLVPVPLHRQRLASRGYNQALEIARPVAARLRLPLLPWCCSRIRPTAEQTGLTSPERRRNLRGAFRASAACRGARIALVDDVITTGSTAADAVRALREAGAADVQVWAAARAVARRDWPGPAVTPPGT